MDSDILTEIGQTMPGSPNILKVQVCHFTVKLPKAASLPITKLYPTAVLHGMSLRSATPLTHQTLQVQTTAFVTPPASEICIREEWSVLI